MESKALESCRSLLLLLNEDKFPFTSHYIHDVLMETDCCVTLPQGMYIKSTYDGLHVITGTTEGVSVNLLVLPHVDGFLLLHIHV